MPKESHYPEALKLGRSEYRACIARGEYPYPPVLDDILPEAASLSSVHLGVINIPTELIAGTESAGRTTMFARNFMPLAPTGSEFACKWAALCDSHMEEGIRESVTAFEFLNRYYIREGNKRVSVLKYAGSPTVSADVTRLLPPKTEQTALYYEYLEFNRLSGLNDFWCARPGSYLRLQGLLGLADGEPWPEKTRLTFHRCCILFKKAYEQQYGGSTGFGDAFLVFLRLYGPDAVADMGPAAMKDALRNIREEIEVLREDKGGKLVMRPDFTPAPMPVRILSSITGAPTLKAAFIHGKDQVTSGWTRAHEHGRSHLVRVLKDRAETFCIPNALEDPAAAIQSAVEQGADLVFTTTPELLDATLSAAARYPKVRFYNCSPNASHRIVRSYYIRTYEAKFVLGALAGVLSRGCDLPSGTLPANDRIGYIADFPIYGSCAAINAFAMGARMTNPKAKIVLEWIPDGYNAAVDRLRQQGISLISGKDYNIGASGAFGLFRLKDGDPIPLATPLWNWGLYYEALLRSELDRMDSESRREGFGAGYWWGMPDRVADVVFTEELTVSLRRLGELTRCALQNGHYRPFNGILRSGQGPIHASPEDVCTPEEIMTMDWLAENVEGDLPDYPSMSGEMQALVNMVGLPCYAEKDRVAVAEPKHKTVPAEDPLAALTKPETAKEDRSEADAPRPSLTSAAPVPGVVITAPAPSTLLGQMKAEEDRKARELLENPPAPIPEEALTVTLPKAAAPEEEPPRNASPAASAEAGCAPACDRPSAPSADPAPAPEEEDR